MLRTLGSVQQQQILSDINEQKDEPFYLKNQLPMFLAYIEGKQEKYQNINEDINKCKQLIQNICDNQIKTKQSLQQISALVEKQQSLKKGMGYFSAKNLVVLQYLMFLKLYQLFKLNGKSLTSGSGLELYKRLAYLKTLLLKLSPVQKKLQYQKNKILKHSDRALITKQYKKEDSQEQINQEQNNQQEIQQEQQIKDEQQEQDVMAFKPRPSSLMKLKQQKQIKLAKNDKYEAPKVSSNLSKEDKMKQRLLRQKQIRTVGLIRRLQSDLIQDDRAEERFLGDELNERFKRKFQQKISYQQDGFVRLPDNKKDKFYMKQMIRNSARKNQLDEDFKEVQMVRQLFDGQKQVQNKILSDKRKKQLAFKKKGYKNNENEQRRQKGKTRPIKKQNKN